MTHAREWYQIRHAMLLVDGIRHGLISNNPCPGCEGAAPVVMFVRVARGRLVSSAAVVPA